MILLVVLGTQAGAAQPAPPLVAADSNSARKVSAADQIPLGRGDAASRNAHPAGSHGAADTGLSTWRVIGALFIVLAIMIAVQYLGRRFLGLTSPGSGGGAIRILTRSAVSPRQQLMLVQVGRRVVLVANSGSQMNALCEISDQDEVAALLGQIQQARTTTPSTAFLSLFKRAGSEFEIAGDAAHELEAPPSQEDVDAEDSATRQELRGLLTKVRSLSRNLRQG